MELCHPILISVPTYESDINRYLIAGDYNAFQQRHTNVFILITDRNAIIQSRSEAKEK